MNIQHPTPNIQHPSWPRSAIWVIGALLLMVVGFWIVSAQTAAPGFVGGFNYTRYHPAPHFRQLELKLIGTEGRELPGSTRRFEIKSPKFQAFQTNGEPLVTIESPECFFEETTRALYSAETLAVQSGDGRFRITGKGFRWEQNKKLLVISNDVRAVIHWTNNAPPLEITARWFEFDLEQRRGVFHEDVRGENPEMFFTCARLTVSGSTERTNRNPLDLIEADGDLEITRKLGSGYAKANRGTYRRAEERMDLIGNAEWKFDGYAGRADRMTAWTNAENLEATGKVALSLPRAALGAAGGLLNTTNTTKSAENGTVTLQANQFSKRGDRLLAEGAVQINDGTNTLTCDRLEGKQASKQSPDEFAIATGNVFVGRAGGGIYSDRADYSKAHNQVSFTGNPRFIQGEVHGTAGRVIARPATGEVIAEDDVTVTFPLAAGSGGTFLDFLPNESTNRVPAIARPDQKVGITARTFRLQDRLAVFAGNVAARQLPADGSEPRLRCGELEIRLAATKKHAESLQARQDVVCERGTVGVTNGPAEYARLDSHTLTANANPATGDLRELVANGDVRFQQTDSEACGERAVYTAADQVLKLIGQPTIKRPEGTYTSERELVWDNLRRKVLGEDYKIVINPETLKRAGELEKLPPP